MLGEGWIGRGGEGGVPSRDLWSDKRWIRCVCINLSVYIWEQGPELACG